MATDFATQLAELQDQLDQLRHYLDPGQTCHVTEIRTRRLTVVDEHDIPRVVLSTRDGIGSVLVRTDQPSGRTTGAELYASDGPEGIDPDAGLCLYREGEVIRTVGQK